MRIIIIQERGRHAKNRKFRECLNFHRAFKRIGIKSIVWGLNFPNFKTPLTSIIRPDDAILLLENYEINNWIPKLTQFKNVKLFWSIDSHCNIEQHKKICNKHGINVVLNSIESDQKKFKGLKNRPKTYWFPNAYPDDLIDYIPGIQRKTKIGFVGNLLNRSKWIKMLENDYNLKPKVMIIGQDMVNEINSYKLHFNRNISNDVNYRTFETLGCQTCLLTNKTENLDKLFKIGKHLVIYDNYNDLKDKIDWLLKDSKKRDEIAKAGYALVKKEHTYTCRAKRLVEIIGENS